MDNKLKDLRNEKGEAISPILPEEVKNYLIDIDGTVTEDVPNEEPERMATCEPTKSRNRMTKNIRHCLKIKNWPNSTLF